MLNTTEGAFWRNVTNDDVMEAIKGSFLEVLCTSAAKNYHGQAPLPIILIQSLVLMGVALTRKNKFADYTVQLPLFPEDWSEEREELDRIQEPFLLCKITIATVSL